MWQNCANLFLKTSGVHVGEAHGKLPGAGADNAHQLEAPAGAQAFLVAVGQHRPVFPGRFGGGLIDVANGFRFTLDGTGGGIQIFPADYGMGIMNLPFGGFLTLGLLIGLMQYALKKGEKKKKLEERAAKEAAAMKEVEE